jgi:carboxyl-terminal processing protease
VSDRRRRVGTHLAAFVCGVVVATAVIAEALPTRSSSASNRDRYAALDTFAEALAYIASSYVDEVDERTLLHAAVRGMVEDLDPHSAFLPPHRYQRLRQDTDGEFGGVGLTLGEPPDDRDPAWPVVEALVRGSPADRAGMKEGDRVVAIAGTDTASGRLPARAWHSRLRGRAGTRVTVRFHRDGWDAPREVALVREQVKIPTVTSALLGGRISYVKVGRFQEASAGDLAAALADLRERSGGSVRALILDLRGNPGGLLDRAVAIADLFLDGGVIVTVAGRAGIITEQHTAHAHGSWTGFPMMVLVDQASASAAEIVAGALQDHGRAEIAGLRTYGKGSVQTFLDLADGSGLKLTTARYLTPSGRSLEGAGIDPDIDIEAFEPEVITAGPEEPGEAAGDPTRTSARLPDITANDYQLRTAHQILRGRLGSKKTKAD